MMLLPRMRSMPLIATRKSRCNCRSQQTFSPSIFFFFFMFTSMLPCVCPFPPSTTKPGVKKKTGCQSGHRLALPPSQCMHEICPRHTTSDLQDLIQRLEREITLLTGSSSSGNESGSIRWGGRGDRDRNGNRDRAKGLNSRCWRCYHLFWQTNPRENVSSRCQSW